MPEYQQGVRYWSRRCKKAEEDLEASSAAIWDLMKANEQFEKALRNIIKHAEIMSPDGPKHTSYYIAKKAVGEEVARDLMTSIF